VNCLLCVSLKYIEIVVANTYLSPLFDFAFVNLGDGRLGRGGEAVAVAKAAWARLTTGRRFCGGAVFFAVIRFRVGFLTAVELR
jgi:hypothetical protein